MRVDEHSHADTSNGKLWLGSREFVARVQSITKVLDLVIVKVQIFEFLESMEDLGVQGGDVVLAEAELAEVS